MSLGFQLLRTDRRVNTTPTTKPRSSPWNLDGFLVHRSRLAFACSSNDRQQVANIQCSSNGQITFLRKESGFPPSLLSSRSRRACEFFTIWLSFFGFALLEKRRREGKKTWPNHHNGTSIVGIWFSHLPTSKMGAGNFIRNGGFTYDWYDLNQLNSLIERWVACTYHVTGGGSPVRERNCRYTRLPNVSAFTRIRECWICKRNEKISAFYSVGVTYSATTSFTGYSYAWFVWHNLAHDIIFISVAYAITLHSIHFVTVDARPVAWWLPLPPLHWKQTFKFQSVTAPSAWYWSHMHLENEGKEDTEMRCLPLLLWLKKQKTRGDRNAHSTEGRSDRMQSTKFKFFRILPKSSSRSRECRQHELSLHLMLSLECAFAVCLNAAEHLKWSNISNEISFEWDD